MSKEEAESEDTNSTVTSPSDDKDSPNRLSPSLAREPSGELADLTLQQPDAKNRHVQFANHVAESAQIVHQLLKDRRVSDTSYRSRAQDEESSHQEDTDRPSMSVLANLLSLNGFIGPHRHRKHNKSTPTAATPTGTATPMSRPGTPQAADSPAPSILSLPTRPKFKTSKSTPDLHALRTHVEEPFHHKQRPHRNRERRPKQWLNSVTSSSHVVPSLEKRQWDMPTSSRRRRRSSADSTYTTASQFDPLTLEDRVRVTFEIANVLQKQEFIRKLTKALMLYGCPAHRLEYILKHVSDTLKVDAEFVYVPNIMFTSFYDSSTHTTETHFIKQNQSFDMHKLAEVYRLEKLVAHGEVTVDEALAFIDQVVQDPQFYPTWLNPFIYALVSFCGCIMFFGGRWHEAGLSAALASMCDVHTIALSCLTSFFFFYFLCSVLCRLRALQWSVLGFPADLGDHCLHFYRFRGTR